jgi:2-oxoglutarate ferredoxin oxidoreductase subunit beta
MPVNPMPLAIVAGATFVSRGFAGDVDHLTGLIKKAVQHKGFAIVDILQPCATFNRRNTYEWYRDREYKLDESDHDPTDLAQALTRAQEWGERIPIGLIYKTHRSTFEERLPGLKYGPLVKQPLVPQSVEKLFNEFM